ncbi:glutamate receptor ionotropic, kainate 3-like [Palaemon carinicauda]|uniref:glutamate receptor ionotropic, kainate 3-like n=1 Tax=Palaemon carinicauda TaxID=392227 RepID=UPI0035B57FD7
MAKPGLKPQWQSLYYPLTDGVWLSIMAALVLVPTVLLMVSRLGSYADRRKRLTTGTVVVDVIGSLFGQMISDRWPKTNSTRLLLSMWFMFSFIICTAYKGNLTAFLTIPKYPNRPETMKQMVAVGATITMPPDLVDFYESFKKSDSELLQTFVKRVTFIPDSKAGLKNSLQKMSAHVYERFYLELKIVEHFTEADGSTPLYVAQENIMPGYCGWPMIKNAPFKPNIDKYIMRFHEFPLGNIFMMVVKLKLKGKVEKDGSSRTTSGNI